MQGPHLPLVSAVRAEGGAVAGAGETLRLPHRAGLLGAVDPARSQEARRVRPSVRGTALGLWLHLETLQAPWSLQGPRAEGREPGVRWFSLPSTLALNTCSGGELAGPHGPPRVPRGARPVSPRPRAALASPSAGAACAAGPAAQTGEKRRRTRRERRLLAGRPQPPAGFCGDAAS